MELQIIYMNVIFTFNFDFEFRNYVRTRIKYPFYDLFPSIIYSNKRPSDKWNSNSSYPVPNHYLSAIIMAHITPTSKHSPPQLNQNCPKQIKPIYSATRNSTRWLFQFPTLGLPSASKFCFQKKGYAPSKSREKKKKPSAWILSKKFQMAGRKWMGKLWKRPCASLSRQVTVIDP